MNEAEKVFREVRKGCEPISAHHAQNRRDAPLPSGAASIAGGKVEHNFIERHRNPWISIGNGGRRETGEKLKPAISLFPGFPLRPREQLQRLEALPQQRRAFHSQPIFKNARIHPAEVGMKFEVAVFEIGEARVPAD